MKTRLQKGNSKFSLEKLIEQHCLTCISIQQCSEYVDYQLPNDSIRARYLIDVIQTSDPELQTEMSVIHKDSNPTGIKNNFEACATFSLLSDSVAKKRKTNSGGTLQGDTSLVTK